MNFPHQFRVGPMITSAGLVGEIDAAIAGKLKQILLKSDTQSVGAASIFDVKKNGVSIFADAEADGPRIATSGYASVLSGLDVTITRQDRISIHALDLPGGGIGNKLTVQFDIDYAGDIDMLNKLMFMQGIPLDLSDSPTVTQLLMRDYDAGKIRGATQSEINSFLNPPPTIDDSPIAALSTLTGWFAARKETGFSDTDPVNTAVNQKTGAAGNLAKQGTAPVFIFDGINGRPTYRFNANGILKGANIENFITSTSFSIFIVAKFNALRAANDSSPIWNESPLLGSGNGNDAFGVSANSSGRFQSLNYRGGSFFKPAVASIVDVDTPRLFEYHYDNATVRVIVDGTHVGSVTTTGGFQLFDYPFAVGGSEQSGDLKAPVDADISEIITTSAELSSGNKTVVRDILNPLYNLNAPVPDINPTTLKLQNINGVPVSLELDPTNGDQFMWFKSATGRWELLTTAQLKTVLGI